MYTMFTFKTHETSNSLKEHQMRHSYIAQTLYEEALTFSYSDKKKSRIRLLSAD